MAQFWGLPSGRGVQSRASQGRTEFGSFGPAQGPHTVSTHHPPDDERPLLLRQPLVDEVLRLLAEPEPRRLSRDEIAKIVGIARGTVSGIARGDRLQILRTGRFVRATHAGDDAILLGPGESAVVPRHCNACGGVINVIPCRLCALLAVIGEARPDPRDGQDGQDSLALDFHDPSAEARYKELRSLKERAAGELATSLADQDEKGAAPTVATVEGSNPSAPSPAPMILPSGLEFLAAPAAGG